MWFFFKKKKPPNKASNFWWKEPVHPSLYPCTMTYMTVSNTNLPAILCLQTSSSSWGFCWPCHQYDECRNTVEDYLFTKTWPIFPFTKLPSICYRFWTRLSSYCKWCCYQVHQCGQGESSDIQVGFACFLLPGQPLPVFLHPFLCPHES